MADYEDILNRSWDEIPEPQLLPVGSFRLKSRGATLIEAKDATQNDRVMFIYSAMEPLQDVDADALAEMGDYDISQNRLFFTVWIESYADWDTVRKHIAKHSLAEVPGETPKETFNRMKGSEVIAWLDQRSFVAKSGDTVETNDPTQFAKVED